MYILVLESESPSIESILAAGLTVCSAAVADAGIPMYALGTGVVVASSGETEADRDSTRQDLVVDPNGKQAREARARVTVGCIPALDAVSDVWLTGETTVEEMVKVGLTNDKRFRRLAS